ncbi:MAG: hypothetical protein K2W96_05435, partial [Gemmataceae bacterium]|nr:hypothetical protein [Gemmataceae bacterium]
MSIVGLLGLREGELRRAWPFFALYAGLFAAFTLADGVALALFVERSGAESLPGAYGLVALANLLLIAGYMGTAERLGGLRMFQAIVGGAALAFGLCWAARELGGGTWWFTVPFVAREIAFTLLLLHFGTFLQSYFTRDELSRVLPAVYAGGRVGGIAGGVLLQHLGRWPGPRDSLAVFAAMCLLCLAALEWVARASSKRKDEEGTDPAAQADGVGEEEARSSLGGFLRYAWASPLLFWLSVSSVLFMLVRWLLNYRYSHHFAEVFESPADMAEFLGRYAQWALLGSLVVQLLVVNRLVSWLGAHGTYVLFALLVAGTGLLGTMEMTLTL